MEPHSYIYRFADPVSGKFVWRSYSGGWNGQKPSAFQGLYTADQLDQAAEAERAAVVADMRQTAQNMRRYPYESATMAEAMVIAARAIQDLADRYERGAHLPTPAHGAD